MKQDNINYFAVGLFVIAAGLILLIALFQITGRGADADDYFVELENVAGIRSGSPVTYAGFEIGQLVDIEPVRTNRQTRYRLHLQVKANWPIPTDSVAQIVTPSLLGEKQIDITEGQSSDYLKVGQTINGKESADVFVLVEQISNEFQKLSEQGLKPLLKTLNAEFAGSLPKLVDQTSVLLTNLNSSALELQGILATVDQRRIDSIMGNAQQVTENLLTVSVKLDQASAEVDKLVNSTSKMMDSNNEDLRKALLDLRTTMGVIEENMTGIMYNIDTSSRNLNEFTRQIRDNPAILLNGKPPEDAAKQ
ncbi:MAG: MlaD family protein [Thioalkalispiraceae bacterium]|jgi:phospholipid/cholesterol/gamma-HCH transport system substrate-binding protein